MTDMQWSYSPSTVSAPGATLQELLDERGMNQKELAARTGRPVKTINEIIRGKAQITPETAVQLERALGLPATFWNEREAHYRGYLARVEADQAALKWLGWLDELPLKEMMEAGVLPRTRLSASNRRGLLDACLRFFGVASPEDWRKVYQKPQTAYKRFMADKSDPGAVAVWLRQGELEAQKLDCAAFNRAGFKVALDEIRGLTCVAPEEFLPRLTKLCAQNGVALALVPAIPRAHVAGASRWINKRALIQLSLYGKWNDRFWFTLFHEAGHILLHERDEVFLDDFSDAHRKNHFEREADEFAANHLIPEGNAQMLRTLRSEVSIREFAKRIGIHPGIVVGRLQHEGILPFGTLNHLKERYAWANERK